MIYDTATLGSILSLSHAILNKYAVWNVLRSEEFAPDIHCKGIEWILYNLQNTWVSEN